MTLAVVGKEVQKGVHNDRFSDPKSGGKPLVLVVGEGPCNRHAPPFPSAWIAVLDHKLREGDHLSTVPATRIPTIDDDA